MSGAIITRKLWAEGNDCSTNYIIRKPTSVVCNTAMRNYLANSYG